ncbi:MAG: SCO family protein [Actinomycetota bacterium]|nr:SCO family protein [Actinomycetota bacterium]
MHPARRPLPRCTAFVAAALLLISGCGGGADGSAVDVAASPDTGGNGSVASNDPGGRAQSLHGTVPEPALPRPSFRLTDTSGKPYDFAERTAGRVTLVAQGYTSCPDICSVIMADIATALRQVPDDVRDSVTVVWLTADPERDTGPKIRAWLDRFDTSFVGLTGTRAEIAAAEKALGHPPSRRADDRVDYAVDHRADVTAYGRNDLVAVVYPPGAVSRDYAADLPKLVKE